MIWLLEDIVEGNPNIQRFKHALEILKVSYQMVQVRDNSLILMDNDLLIPLANTDENLNKLRNRNDVFIYGGKKLLEAATTLELSPGAFSSERFNYTNVLAELSDELLNPDVCVDYIENIPIPNTDVFVRPEGNTKYIDGKVYTKEEFLNLRDALLLREREKLVVSTVKQIDSEYRFYIIGSRIIAASQYAPQIAASFPNEKELETYVKKIVKTYNITIPYVLDIANTPRGYKVIEYNNLSTSGLYNIDVLHLVQNLVTYFIEEQTIHTEERENLLLMRLEIIECLIAKYKYTRLAAIDAVNTIDFMKLGEQHLAAIMHYTIDDWADWLHLPIASWY